MSGFGVSRMAGLDEEVTGEVRCREKGFSWVIQGCTEFPTTHPVRAWIRGLKKTKVSEHSHVAITILGI